MEVLDADLELPLVGTRGRDYSSFTARLANLIVFDANSIMATVVADLAKDRIRDTILTPTQTQ